MVLQLLWHETDLQARVLQPHKRWSVDGVRLAQDGCTPEAHANPAFVKQLRTCSLLLQPWLREALLEASHQWTKQGRPSAPLHLALRCTSVLSVRHVEALWDVLSDACQWVVVCGCVQETV